MNGIRRVRSSRRSVHSLLLFAALVGAPPLAAQSAYEQLQTFSGLLNQVRLNYVDSVTTGTLVNGAIAGMLSALDPHSRFVPRDEHLRLMSWRAGELAGAGLVVETADDALVVQSVYPNGPAARAGVQPGDRIVSVNDTVVVVRDADAVQVRLIGERGTRVTITLARGPRLEPEVITVRLRFDIIRPLSVPVARSLGGGVGYVRLAEFLEAAGREVHDAVGRALRGGATSLILDLRGNPGGDVRATVDVASEFLRRDQLVFRTHGRRRSVIQEYRTSRDGDFRNVAMVVLIDEHSASAAEALAGALQDHDRALIAGRRSFGKALMQQLLLVPPNDDVVWLTVGYLLTPNGRLIQRRYRGLTDAQYRALAGRAGPPDSAETFRTDNGRAVTGSGGIRPDTLLPGVASLPAWFAAAADSGFDHAIADSVAATLTADEASRQRWIAGAADWHTRVVEPFLSRVRRALNVRAELDPAVAQRLARILAYRVTEVRWGDEAALDFRLRNDPDIQAALALFPQLPRLLSPQN